MTIDDTKTAFEAMLAELEIPRGPALKIDPVYPQAGGYLDGIITVRPAPIDQLLLTLRHEMCHWLLDRACSQPEHTWQFYALRALLCAKMEIGYWGAADEASDQASGNFFVAAPLFTTQLSAARCAARQCFKALRHHTTKPAAELARLVALYCPRNKPAAWLPWVTDRYVARETAGPAVWAAALAAALLISGLVADGPRLDIILIVLSPLLVAITLDNLFRHFSRLGIVGQHPIIPLN